MDIKLILIILVILVLYYKYSIYNSKENFQIEIITKFNNKLDKIIEKKKVNKKKNLLK